MISTKQGLLKRILKTLAIASIVGAVAYVLIWMLLQGYAAAWTGFADFTRPDGEFVRGKTLWDWMELLIIPLVLAGGALYLNRSERNNEREIAIDRQQEAAFQSYLDRMADLLLRENLRTTRNKEVRDVARTRTLTMLRGLDANRKGLVINFLYEANLITGAKPIVILEGADLIGANLHGDLTGACLEGVILDGANLQDTQLSSARLQHASLKGANLEGARLDDAIMDHSHLHGANLKGAFLYGTDLDGSVLKGANLRGAWGIDKAYFKGAILKGAIMADGKKHKTDA